MSFPFKEIVFDGGALIELLLSGVETELFKNIVDQQIIPSSTILAIIEAKYILCRKLGKEHALEKVNSLLDSNYFDIISLDSIQNNISLLKCLNLISLPDCATIALATDKNIPALFARREKELITQVGKKAFTIQIFFIEDF